MGMTDEEIAKAQATMDAEAKFVPEPQPETPKTSLRETIRQRPWLHIAISFALAALFFGLVQAALIPFLEVENASHGDYRLMALVASVVVVFFVAPELKPKSSLLKGFVFTTAYFASFFAIAVASAMLVYNTELYFHDQQQARIAAAEQQAIAEAAQYQREQEASRLAAIQQQRKQRKAAVDNAIAGFQFAASPSACNWGELPTAFSQVSYRHKVKALFTERSQALQKCLQEEMNKNFDRYSALLIRDVGGALDWEEGASASAWRDVPKQMTISYPIDVCDESCRQQLLKLKAQVGEIAQVKADAFDASWKAYMKDVVDPAIKLGDELDWEAGREQREKEAAEQAYLEASRRGLRNADGGFGDMMKGISRASNEMARQVESPSSRYQRQQNEYYQQQGAKKYWDSKSTAITLHSETRPPSPEQKQAAEKDCVTLMGFKPKNLDKPVCKLPGTMSAKEPLCPRGVPNDGHCPQQGYGIDHCLVSPCEGECSCHIQK